MTSPALDSGPSARHPWTGRAAFGFVLTTLLLLVVVPILVQLRVTALRGRIEASEPARTLVARLHFHFATEVVSGGGPLPGREGFAGALAAEEAIHRQLAPLAGRLSPEVEARYRAVRALGDRWHARRGAAEPPRRPEDLRLFERLLAANEALDGAILETTRRTRSQIMAAERAGLRLTVLLGVLAMIAAGIVAWFEAGIRRYAAEAERRRAEAELKRREAEAAVAETARANEARVRLLRGVTHDVKNPLGAAKGYAELLAMGVRTPMHPDQAPLVEGVRRSVDGALAIIADLLDIARADGGGLGVHRSRVDLSALLDEVADDHRPAAETAGHRLERGAGPVPVHLHTDPARVRQILGNLLTNAVKYTPAPGRITARVERVERAGPPLAGDWACIHVDDTGAGVPADHREAIFDEFTRLDDASPTRGHGLGLAIARRIARLLGGDLTVGDAPGGGARFTLWLPLRAEEPGA